MKRKYFFIFLSSVVIVVLCTSFIKGHATMNVAHVQVWSVKRPKALYSYLLDEKFFRDNYLKYEYLRIVNRNANAGTYLLFKTYDGKDQPMHPDVLYFDKKFRGHKYWMAYTPYPDSDERYENPCIAVSEDGFDWKVPQGLRNPIAPPPNDLAEHGHYSDTEMISDNGKLVVFFVYNRGGVVGPSKFFRVISQDGIKWSKPELIYQTTADTSGYSPAVIREDKDYSMWYVSNGNRMFLTTSKDGKVWDAPKKCELDISGWTLWHIDVIKTNLGYEGLLCAINNTLRNRALFYMKSSDGINWTYNNLPIIYPSNSGWDSVDIYRATMLKQDDLYRIWYSAKGPKEKWHIGYTEGKSVDTLKGYNNY